MKGRDAAHDAVGHVLDSGDVGPSQVLQQRRGALPRHLDDESRGEALRAAAAAIGGLSGDGALGRGRGGVREMRDVPLRKAGTSWPAVSDQRPVLPLAPLPPLRAARACTASIDRSAWASAS